MAAGRPLPWTRIKMSKDTRDPDPVPFGSILGHAPGGVASYSSDYDSADDTEFTDRNSYRSFVDGVRKAMKSPAFIS
jgi:hypothetical protein